MLRIRKISNPYAESNLQKIGEVVEIVKAQFPGISDVKASEFIEQLVNPFKYKFLTTLFIAEDIHDNLRGFAILMYMSDLHFCYLDFIAITPGTSSTGIGGALYQRVREEALILNAKGVFFECLPDDPELCRDKSLLPENQKRLAFYERYGAKPVIHTKYESKVKPEDDCPPYLVFDGLGMNNTISGKEAREIVAAILQRKFSYYCDEEYIQMVVGSITDDPIQLRPNRYLKKSVNRPIVGLKTRNKIEIFINEKHPIHHVRERGYVESPVRIKSITREIFKTNLFVEGEVKKYPEKFILSVHDRSYYDYFKKTSKTIAQSSPVYPYVFPIRNNVRAPKELSVRAGYYCFDTFTPISLNAFLAAVHGVNATLSATDSLIEGRQAVYVLTRPPGHHAEQNAFGGFCYFNNAAIAAERLSKLGKVAILDIDYHHGNGQQQIFYERSDVLTISVHGHPSFAYPYFSGFEDEKGQGEGLAYNYNFPLPEKLGFEAYLKVLLKSVNIIRKFKAEYLIIALGLDTSRNDPTGTWDFRQKDLSEAGKVVGEMKLPTLITQEGGYNTHSLGSYARHFFDGFYQSRFEQKE